MSEGNPLAKGAAWMNGEIMPINEAPVSYTHLRAHETDS